MNTTTFYPVSSSVFLRSFYSLYNFARGTYNGTLAGGWNKRVSLADLYHTGLYYYCLYCSLSNLSHPFTRFSSLSLDSKEKVLKKAQGHFSDDLEVGPRAPRDGSGAHHGF